MSLLAAAEFSSLLLALMKPPSGGLEGGDPGWDLLTLEKKKKPPQDGRKYGSDESILWGEPVEEVTNGRGKRGHTH